MLHSILPEVPVTVMFRGLVPFIAADLLRLALTIYVPWVVLFLPKMMQ